MSAARVLRRYGCEVDLPQAQVCCGQPAFNSGYHDEARDRGQAARRDASPSAEHMVSPSGSCCGMIRHYFPQLFAHDAGLLREAESLREPRLRVLAIHGSRPWASSSSMARFPHKVTYHPSCHGARLLGIREEPLALLRAIRDLELVPLPKADDCCGFGGTFAIKLAPISAAIVDEKVAHITETNAHYVVGTDLVA